MNKKGEASSHAHKKEVRVYNRRATFEAAIQSTYEAGVVLRADEIKSIRAGHAQMNGSYVKFMGGKKGNPVIVGLHLSHSIDPERTRDLLLHRKEMVEISRSLEEKGMLAVPLELYLRHGWVKIKIGIGRGRRQFDKRSLLRERDMARERDRELKRPSRP